MSARRRLMAAVLFSLGAMLSLACQSVGSEASLPASHTVVPDMSGASTPTPTSMPQTAKPTATAVSHLGASSARIELGHRASASIDLEVDEPSGLAWSPVRGALWVVSDDEPALASVSEDGAVLDRVPFAIPSRQGDWEGVTELPSGQVLVVSEIDRLLLVLDPEQGSVDEVVNPAALPGGEGLAAALAQGGSNSGLEGVAVGANGSVWVAKEAEPALLIELAPDRSRVLRWFDPTATLAASIGTDRDEIDLSGLTFDPTDPTVLWIASHQSAALFVWDTSTDSVIRSHAIATPKLEGVAITPDGGILAVDDKDETLLALAG